MSGQHFRKLAGPRYEQKKKTADRRCGPYLSVLKSAKFGLLDLSEPMRLIGHILRQINLEPEVVSPASRRLINFVTMRLHMT